MFLYKSYGFDYDVTSRGVDLEGLNNKELDIFLSNLDAYSNKFIRVPFLVSREVPVREMYYEGFSTKISARMEIRMVSPLDFELSREDILVNEENYLRLELKSFSFENSHNLFLRRLRGEDYILLPKEMRDLLSRLMKFLPRR